MTFAGISAAAAGRAFLGMLVCAGCTAFAQPQNYYTAVNATGQLILARTVDLAQFQMTSASRTKTATIGAAIAHARRLPEESFSLNLETPLTVRRGLAPHPRFLGPPPSVLDAGTKSMAVTPAWTGFGFDALSHFDQRNASSGNQFSIEPPNPSIAVANGYILEGVNNAVRVFSTAGTPLIQTISSNQLFGLAPAIDRVSGVNGPYPTDMRVFFDSDIGRWFVLQRAQDVDVYGNPLNRSHLYLAVSQSPDPTAVWNIYQMDTTDASNPGCPCLPDYPQIGADQFGLYISADEYDTQFYGFVDATILAISKDALGVGGPAPTTYQFRLPLSLGFEFAIQPATTPPGASKYLASGGVEYFVSSQASYSGDTRLGLFALSNTASLRGGSNGLLLTEATVSLTLSGSAISYIFPYIATQPAGPLPLGSSIESPAFLPFVDGGPDSRVQSLTYSGGRLFVTLPTQVIDSGGNSVVGGAYVILAPTFRNGTLNAPVLKQGYLSVAGNHVLRPAISVDAKGAGAIAFTLVGPDYFASAAFVSLNTTYPNTGIIDPGPPSDVVIAGPGALPEDGFTAYPPQPTAPVARWGDYSTAVTSTDGSIWMVAEYIPDAPRTQYANWRTFIYRYVPTQ